MEAAPKARPRDTLQAAIAADKRDFDARFELAQSHFAKGEMTQAMDELLEILMRDKAWKDELARKTYVAILQLMTKSAPAPKAEAADKKGALEVAGKMVAAPADPGRRQLPAQAQHDAVLSAARRRSSYRAAGPARASAAARRPDVS
jgi:putative thioredoxin